MSHDGDQSRTTAKLSSTIISRSKSPEVLLVSCMYQSKNFEKESAFLEDYNLGYVTIRFKVIITSTIICQH